MVKRYVWNMLISIDQFFNTLAGGDPDETISSRAGKRAEKGCKACILLCKFLSLFEKDHCYKSIEPDEGEPM
ncbi:hypothetical protein KZ483_24035 [Paenibacillus sp. sptzw28]|uniref:hypothetical protein n=1 Tax=Paenibacillus sp. sptzw28 TaxID=715179 RepID=UPI001C6E7DA2|nr:hypothetical protein [Paenibacillus sp. sptzw28]QYR20793.1 hypothetical protein KZ483_24035 [Paenibacillus sp. sptzw28]